MFGKTKNYILNTANIEEADYDKVGKQAKEAADLAKTGVIVPNSIVLITEAFDDFITAADLADRIAEALANVKADDPHTFDKASQTITALIEQASFPSLILNPLIQSYKSISGFSDKYVKVIPSWTLAPELMPDNYQDCVRLNVKGEPALLYALKQSWNCLFTPQAIQKRVELNYHGGLTIATMIQKLGQAEISGKAFTRDPITNDPAIMIEAILGLDTDRQAAEIVPDVYRVDPEDMRIREKNIMSQEYMYLRKGRAQPDEDPNMRVTISPEWRRRQKLPDHYVTELARITQKLTQHYGYAVELRWAYETGQLIITSAQEFKPLLKPEVDMQTEIDKALKIESPLEILPVTPMLPPEGKFAMKQVDRRVDIKSLAAEVEDMVNNNEITPELNTELEVEAEPIAAEEIPMVIDQMVNEHIDAEPKELKSSLGLLTNIYLDISDMSTDKLANAASFDGVYLDGTHTVLRHKILPETITKDKQKLSNLIESYALEISTAAKVIEPRPIYYSFSDIGDLEREKLGVKPTGLNGSERFLDTPEAMITEILAIKRARTTYNAKNIKLILPRLRTETELSDVKKILSSQNMRRSSVMQLLAEISVPAMMYELIDVSAHELDGLMINFEKLAKSITGRQEISERDYSPVLNAIRFMLDQNSAKKFVSMMRVPAKRELIQDTMSLNLGGYVFSEIPETSLLEMIKAMESNQLKPVPVKRGRRPKSL